VLQLAVPDEHLWLPPPAQPAGHWMPLQPTLHVTSHAHDPLQSMPPEHALFAEHMTLHAPPPQSMFPHACAVVQSMSHDLAPEQSIELHACAFEQLNVHAKPAGHTSEKQFAALEQSTSQVIASRSQDVHRTSGPAIGHCGPSGAASIAFPGRQKPSWQTRPSGQLGSVVLQVRSSERRCTKHAASITTIHAWRIPNPSVTCAGFGRRNVP
jgi:hypothetical protein